MSKLSIVYFGISTAFRKKFQILLIERCSYAMNGAGLSMIITAIALEIFPFPNMSSVIRVLCLNSSNLRVFLG